MPLASAPASAQQTQPPLPQDGYAQSTSPIKHPEPLALDTTTPMVKPGAVTRFTASDARKYAPWLLQKLTARWPNVSAMTFSGWIVSWSGSNMFCFVKTEHAIGLAEVYRCTPELQNRARMIFCFCEDFKNENQHEEMLQIYRHIKQWGRSVGVSVIEDVDNASDLSNARLRAGAAAKSKNFLVFEI